MLLCLQPRSKKKRWPSEKRMSGARYPAIRSSADMAVKKSPARYAPGLKVWERMPERQDLYPFAGAISQVHNAQGDCGFVHY